MYGLRRIRLAAAMTRLTAAGAVLGAKALPLMSRAFLIGLQVVGARVRPPLEASLQPEAWAGEAKAESPMKVSAARVAATARLRRALKERNDWFVRDGLIPNLLGRPTGLAVGLAL